MSGAFSGIPPEILLSISSFLDTSSFCAFRRTCSTHESILFETFAKDFFAIKQFMFTHRSLQALLDISCHVALSSHVKKVIIGTNVIPAAHGDPGSDPKRIYHVQQWRDHQFLTQRGLDVIMLTKALRNLNNCRTIEIRDFNSQTRFRDGPEASWHSYGATEFFAQSGVTAEIAMGNNAWSTHVFGATILAIVDSGMTCESLMMTTRHHALGRSAFNIPSWDLLKFTKALSSIKTLMLVLAQQYDGVYATAASGGVEVLSSFLELTPTLETIRLNFDSYFNNNISLIAAGNALVRASATIRRLEIGKTVVEETTMKLFLGHFRDTIKHVVLFQVRIDLGSWESMLSYFQSLPALQSIRLDWPGQIESNRRSNAFVGFKQIGADNSSSVDPADLVAQVYYETMDNAAMFRWLEELKDRIVVQDKEFRRLQHASTTGNTDGSVDSDDSEHSENSLDSED